MATTGRSRGSVSVDTVPLPDMVLQMPTKRGKVLKQNGRYFISVGGRKVEIPGGTMQYGSEIAELVNKDVFVAFSLKRPSQIVAIGTWPTPERPRINRRWIICYIPVPDIVKLIEPAIRNTLLEKMVSEKIITKELAAEVRLAGW